MKQIIDRTNIEKEISGVRTWYDLIATKFDKRCEGIDGYYWESFESKIVNEMIDVKNKVVLDLGCGGGRYAISVCQKVKKVIGIDISEKLIQIANEKLTPDMPVKFLMGDSTNICFRNECFDVIVSLGMFEYLKNPTPFLFEINRILKPNGILLFVCHNRYPSNFLVYTKVFQQIIKPTLRAIIDYLFPSVENVNSANYYGSSLEVRAKYWTVVAHDLQEIRDFLWQNKLELIDYRTIIFKITDSIFNIGKRIKNNKLQNNIFSLSVFLNRFLGSFFLTKNYGGNFVIKAMKIGR